MVKEGRNVKEKMERKRRLCQRIGKGVEDSRVVGLERAHMAMCLPCKPWGRGPEIHSLNPWGKARSAKSCYL